MPGTFDKSNWRGRNLLEKLELFSFFLFYTLIFVVFIFLRQNTKDMGLQLFIWLGVGVTIYIIAFVAFQQYVYRRIADKYNGIPVMVGWIDQEDGLGEEYEFLIENITPFERLSTVEKESVERWIEEDKKLLEEFDKNQKDPMKYLGLENKTEKVEG